MKATYRSRSYHTSVRLGNKYAGDHLSIIVIKIGFTILPVNPCFYCAEGETRTLTEFNPNRILSPKSDSGRNFNVYNINLLFINKLTPPNRHKSTPFNTNYQPEFTLKLSRIGHVKY